MPLSQSPYNQIHSLGIILAKNFACLASSAPFYPSQLSDPSTRIKSIDSSTPSSYIPLPPAGRLKMAINPWSVAFASAALNAFQTGAFFFTPTTVMPTIVTEFNIPVSLSTLPIAIGKVTYVLLLTPGGTIVDTVGPRRTVILGISLLALLFFIYASLAESLLFLIVLHILVAFPAAVSGVPVYSVFVSQWFNAQNIGLPMGLVLSGFSAAGTLFPAILGGLIDIWGWRTAMLGVVGLLAFVALPLAHTVLHENPTESTTILPHRRNQDTIVTVDDFPVPQAEPPSPSSRPYIFMAIASSYAFLQYCSGCFLENILFFLTMDRGMKTAAASLFFSSINLSAFSAKLVGGYLGDRFNRLKVAASASGIAALGIAFLFVGSSGLDNTYVPTLTHHTFFIFLFTILYGFGYGATFNSLYALGPTLFGKKNIGRTQSVLFGIGLIGNAIGSVVTSVLRSKFDSYRHAFLLSFIMSALNFLVFAGINFALGNVSLAGQTMGPIQKVLSADRLDDQDTPRSTTSPYKQPGVTVNGLAYVKKPTLQDNQSPLSLSENSALLDTTTEHLI